MTRTNLNELAGTSYSPNSKSTVKLITARLKDGCTEQDLCLVNKDRCRRWLSDSKMREYLRPETLYSEKHFESYLASAKVESNGRYFKQPRSKGESLTYDDAS
jgi:uncharacterized phage protein (TIGR02220 family)